MAYLCIYVPMVFSQIYLWYLASVPPGVISLVTLGAHVVALLSHFATQKPGALTKALHHREQSDPLAFQWIEDTYEARGTVPPHQTVSHERFVKSIRSDENIRRAQSNEKTQ